MKKVSNTKSNNVSYFIDSKTGRDACDIFYDKYRRLYTRSSENSLNSIINQCNVKIELDCIGHDNALNSHLHFITPVMVQSAVKRLKKGKKDECNFSICSDCFINAPPILFYYLSVLFNFMLNHFSTNDIFNAIILIPIYKNKGKKDSSDNYRAIALNNSLNKILDYILIEFFGAIFESSHHQFAYKENFSTLTCSFITKETIEYYKTNSTGVVAALLDCSKAFDMIDFHKLFKYYLSQKCVPKSLSY